MALKLKVPTMACSGCADTISKAITTVDSNAKIEVDVEAKTVSLESEVAEESLKQALVATGHTVEGYQ